MTEAKRIVKARPDWLSEKVLRADEIPSVEFQGKLVMTAMNTRVKDVDFWEIGKKLQYLYPGKIPFKTEFEVSAGYWHWLRGELGMLT